MTGGDRFHQAYRNINTSANVEVLGCIDALPDVAADALTGVMFRGNGVSGVAANAFLGLRGATTLVWQNRAGSNGGTSVQTEIPNVRLPLCLRIKRLSTNQVQGAWSQDGLNWTTLSALTVNIGQTSASMSVASASGSDALRARAIVSRACVGSFTTEPTPCMIAASDLLFRNGFEF